MNPVRSAKRAVRNPGDSIPNSALRIPHFEIPRPCYYPARKISEPPITKTKKDNL